MIQNVGPGAVRRKTDEDRFAGVERVTHDGQVEDHLERDADRREPHHHAAITGSHDRSEKPFAGTHRASDHDQPRADQSRPAAPTKARSRREFARAPSRHEPGGLGYAVVVIGGSHVRGHGSRVSHMHCLEDSIE